MHKDFYAINEELIKAMKTKEATIESLTAKLESDSSVVDEATEKMKAAVIGGDVKAYQTAKRNLNDAQASIELFSIQLDRANNEELVCAEEGQKLVSEIHSLQKARLEAFKRDIQPLLSQIIKCSAEAFTYIDDGNKIIDKWCADVAPFKKVIGYRGTEPVYMDDTPDYTDYYEYLNFINRIQSSSIYKSIMATNE